MLNNIKLLTLASLLIISGCATQALKSPSTIDSSQIIYDNSAINNVSEVTANNLPLQIATWSPTKYNGRFTAMTVGYLTKFENCLALTEDSTKDTTKDNTYLLGSVEHS